MASPKFSAPQGTHDTLPPESRRWEALLALFADQVGRAGYGLLQTPTFEDLGVFTRVGEGTDIVTKEMYEFEDKGGRRLALRPEGTASVVRSYLEHRPTDPWKVWYATPTFRYERPQAGRYRQHHQLGIEALGSHDPELDAEVITLAWDFFRAVGLRDVRLLLNSMGEQADRAAYADALRSYLTEHLGDLAEADREKVEGHPLRVLDSKRPETMAVTDQGPRAEAYLSDAAREHFEQVKAYLGQAGVGFDLEPKLVRGLDYYTNTTFEFQASALDAAQNAIGGGGRYDGLAEALGGPPTPGIGFGIGIERLLLAATAEATFEAPPARIDVFVVDVVGGAAFPLVHQLRGEGFGADQSFTGRSMKSQMKQADRSGAAYALILGEDELRAGTVSIKSLRRDEEQQTVARDDLIDTIRRLTSDDR